MAIAVYFHPKGMTLEQFNETHRRLDEVCAAEPQGRIHHSCFDEDGDFMVYDICELPETFQAFGSTLMPILADIGVDPGEPAVLAIHCLQQTSARATG